MVVNSLKLFYCIIGELKCPITQSYTICFSNLYVKNLRDERTKKKKNQRNDLTD